MAKGNKAIGCAGVIGGFFVIAVISALIGGGNSDNTKRASAPLSTTIATVKTTRVTTATTTAETTTEKLTEAPETKATEPKTYWLNTESGKYHKAGCRTIKDGTTESYWQSTTDIDWLRENYESCGVCKPY